MTRCELERPAAPRMAPPARAAAQPSLSAIVALALLLLLLLPPRAGAAIPEGPVTRVRIEGNSSITEDQIRAKLKSRPGRPLHQDIVEADIKALHATKWFSDAKAFYDPDPNGKGYILIFQVTEMPVLKAVEFRGRSKVSLKDLEENTGLKAGARADRVRTLAAVRQIRQLYEDKGYELAEVKLIEGGKDGDVRVVFEIFEGPKFQVGGIAFEGNTVFPDATLRTKIGSRPPILGLAFGKYHKEGPEEDARKLVDYYHGLGYFEAKVTPVVRAGAHPGDLRLTFVISEGVQYKVREIRFEGNQKLATAALREGLVLHSGQPFSDALRTLDAASLRSKYSRIGCIDIQIAPEPTFTATPGVVDLVYKVEEGDQYILGKIEIKGNARTREKVIRREFVQSGLLPGEPLDGTRIEGAKQRLGNLQYFVTAPDQGKPIEIKIVNRRPPDQPYGEVAAPDLDAVVRTRLQSGDDPPPIPRRPAEPLAPGPGPGVVPFGSEGAFDPQVDTLPPLPVPGPPSDLFSQPPGGRRVAPPVGSGEPIGTFPSLPGGNATDVGPDRQEPFPNRSFADIATQVEPAPGGSGRSYADIDVQVDEAPTGRVLLGVGASSFGGLSGNLIVHEKNFDLFAFPRSARELVSGQAFRGAGQDFRLELSPGTLINRAVVSFREPYLFDRPISLGVSGYTFSRLYPDFNESRGGGRFSLGRQFGTQTYADVAVRVEDVGFSGFRSPAPADYLAASGHTFLASLRPSVRFDNRNDPFVPSKGQYLELAFEQGWGDFTFPKFTAEGRQHFTLGSRPDQTGKRILTMRGFFGVSGRDTPVYERFYAGDFRSMRGFAYRGVGPRILGSNIGGILTAIGSVEYQFPLIANDQLQAVVFSDFGTVEPDYDFTTFRAAVGAGLRVVVPALGPLPLAFDLAFPVSQADGDVTRNFTFFIGAFW